MFKRSALILALSALAAAQSLSASCQTALTAADNDPATANCTDLNGLLNILLVPANQSLITPITAFVSGFCAAPLCSTATIQAVATNITTACGADLAGLGISSDEVGAVAGLAAQFFPVLKNLLCLADSQTHEYCVTEILDNVQSFTGVPLTIANIKGQLPALTGDAAGLANGNSQLPTNITCTPCVQAAYITLKDALPGTINGSAEASAIAQQCGAAFEAADATSSVVFEATGTSALSASATHTGAATRIVPAAGALVALAAAFVSLA